MSRLPFVLVLFGLATSAGAAEAVSEVAEHAPAAEVEVIPEPEAEPAPDPAADAGLEVIGEVAPEPEPAPAPDSAENASLEIIGEVAPEPEPLPPIPRPSMNYSGFSAFEYASEPVEGVNGRYWKGSGIEINFGWQASEFAVITGRLRHTQADLERSSNTGETTEDHYEVGLAFAAPLAERTRLLLEMGWAQEEFNGEVRADTLTTITVGDSQGLYAAIELRTMLGRWFELDLRSTGHQLFDTRRQVHSAGFRFHVSRRVAFGMHQERWERDLRETTRTSLDMRVDF